MKNYGLCKWWVRAVVLAGLMLGPVQAADEVHVGDQLIRAESGNEDNDGADNEAGKLTVEGDVDAKQGLGIGTANGQPALSVTYAETGSLYEVLMTAHRAQAVFEWWDSLENPQALLKMRLGGDNSLSLFDLAYDSQSADLGIIRLLPKIVSGAGASSIEIDGMKVLVEGGEYSPDDIFGDSGSLAVGDGASTGAYLNALALGQGAEAAADDQAVLGSFNESDADDLLQIGNGTDANNRANALTVERDGDLAVGRDLLVSRNATVSDKIYAIGDVRVTGVLRIEERGGLSMGNYRSDGESAPRGLDADTVAYSALLHNATGKMLSAAQQDQIDAMIVYLKDENLWLSTRVVIANSNYNAGSGNVVYSFGGLGDAKQHFLTVGDPAWQSNGFELTAGQKILAPDDQGQIISSRLEELTLMMYAKVNTPGVVSSGSDAILTKQYGSFHNASFQMKIHSNGTDFSHQVFEGDTSGMQNHWENHSGTGPGLYKNYHTIYTHVYDGRNDAGVIHRAWRTETSGEYLRLNQTGSGHDPGVGQNRVPNLEDSTADIIMAQDYFTNYVGGFISTKVWSDAQRQHFAELLRGLDLN